MGPFGAPLGPHGSPTRHHGAPLGTMGPIHFPEKTLQKNWHWAQKLDFGFATRGEKVEIEWREPPGEMRVNILCFFPSEMSKQSYGDLVGDKKV